MADLGLTRVKPDDYPFFFWGDEQKPADTYYKIYNDGGHYIATPIKRNGKAPKAHNYGREDIDILFDSLYSFAAQNGYKRAETIEYIKAGIRLLFPDMRDLDGFIDKKIERKIKNLYKRRKRFKRKANLNRWTHFVTITYDDSKHTPETFRKTLRKCLSNFHTRRGWRYMGVFEYAPVTGRLHFHALMYIPHGEMVGIITERKDYDTRHGKLQTTYSNSFFANSFGRNDFKELNAMELKNGNALDYILKYIGKTDERIVYSRGIPTEICMKLTENEIVTGMFDYVKKYILFDNVIDWEKNVMHFKPKQMTMIDLLCNPPRQIA